MAPQFAEAARRLQSFSDQVLLAKVNGEEHHSLLQRFQITGFPWLLWFPKGSSTPQNFDAGRDANSILQFVERRAGIRVPYKSAFNLKDASRDEFDAFINDKSSSGFVMFYADCNYSYKLIAFRVRTLQEIQADH